MAGLCRDCEWCMPDINKGYICAENNVDVITETLQEFKECYSEGLEAFSKRQDKLDAANTKLVAGQRIKDIKLDGRKSIYLKDAEGKMIKLKTTLAKKAFGELQIIRVSCEDTFYVDIIFNPEKFQGGNMIILR